MPLDPVRALAEIDHVLTAEGVAEDGETWALIAAETVRRWAPADSMYVERATFYQGAEEGWTELRQVLSALRFAISRGALEDFEQQIHEDLRADLPRRSPQKPATRRQLKTGHFGRAGTEVIYCAADALGKFAA